MLISAASVALLASALDAVAKGVTIVRAIDALNATTTKMKSEGRTEPTMADITAMIHELHGIQDAINNS